MVDGETIEILPLDLSQLISDAGSYIQKTSMKEFSLKFDPENDIRGVNLTLKVDSLELKSEVAVDDFLQDCRSKTLDEHIIY